MKLRHIKTATVLIAAIVLTTSTAGAASGVGAVTVPITGSITSAAQSANTPLGKVTDGKFTLTLEQAMTFGDKIAIVYSVEGNTEGAKAEVMEITFNYGYTVKLPSESGIQYEYRQSGEMSDFRTPGKKYFYGIVEVQANPKGLPISFGLNAMTNDTTYISTPVNDQGTAFMLTNAVASGRDELYITIPMNIAGKVLELTIPRISGRNTVVTLTPVNITVEKLPAPGYGDFSTDLDMSFRMEDGSLRSVNDYYRITGAILNEGPVLDYEGVACNIVDLTKFKSVIVGNKEYNFK